ncbi:ubiquitin-specific protease ubp15 [Coemansia sp. Benny D115]|nr:ubiquitin-specific protease ubp15 [Coemansia sp. Benny D115]
MDHNSEGDLGSFNHTANDGRGLRGNSGSPPAFPPNADAYDSSALTPVASAPPAPPSVIGSTLDSKYKILSPLDEQAFIDAHMPPTGKNEVEGHGWMHWEIDDWSQLPARAVSDTFTVAGCDWKILLFPRGNQSSDVVSLYVDYQPKPSEADEDWHVCAMFTLVISNKNSPEYFKVSSAHHRFSPEETDWGFTRFVDMRSLMTPADEESPPLLENGRVRVSAFVSVIKDPLGVLWHNFVNYNSRKFTGYVGLRNQGATCYMNSLLQSLYFTNEFRNAVYQIPTQNDDPKKSVALALQRVFYNLEVSAEPVDTTELTKSFGWDSLDSFMQHDVQEFNRVLQDSLETKMKGTAVDGALAKLFGGTMKSYIRCVNIDYESSRKESFYDISLNVKGCKTLRDSFVNYCEVEMLDGENKYQAEGHGLQDARKGVIFESFPPVLQLQLKRFEYDYRRDAMVKINDRHEFPRSIDLSDFLSDEADRSMPWDYVLHGVLVHSGDLHGGHYFALLRPTSEDKWFRFDDDRVTPIGGDDMFDEFFGGEYPQMQQQHQPPMMPNRNRQHAKRFTNAYMLVYIRKSMRDEVLGGGNKSQVPGHLLELIQREKAEAERLQREEQERANTLMVNVVSNADFQNHHGFDLCHYASKQGPARISFAERVPRTMTLNDFKTMYAQRVNKNPSDFRLWSMVGRINKTVRCEMPLPIEAMSQTIEQLKNTRSFKWPELRLYCEDRQPSLSPEVFLSQKTVPEISMIHIKYYDLEKHELSGMDSLYIHSQNQVGHIIPSLQSMVGLAPDVPITLYEEVKPSLIEEMDVEKTFREAEIQSGDIICFQLAHEPGKPVGPLDTVPGYFEDLQTRISVRFIPRPRQQDAFGANNSDDDEDTNGPYGDQKTAPVLRASTRTGYDFVAQWLAQKIGEPDPLKLRFYTVSHTGQMRQQVRRMVSTTLRDMIATNPYVQAGLNGDSIPEYTIMYERLELSILQMESMSNIRVTYVGKSMRDERQFEVLVSKTGLVSDLMEATYAKIMTLQRSSQRGSSTDVNAPAAGSPTPSLAQIRPQDLRYYTSSRHRFGAILKGNEPLSTLGLSASNEIVVEHMSESDMLPPHSGQLASDMRMDTDEDSQLPQSDVSGEVDIEVFHFYSLLSDTHSLPFLFRVYPGETWPSTWARLQRKLGLGEKELKNMGVVYGPPGVAVAKRCFVIQDSVRSCASTPVVGANNNSGSDIANMQQQTPGNTPTPPPVAPGTEEQNGGLSESVGNNIKAGADNMDELCLWDLIQRSVSARDDPAIEQPRLRSVGTPTGFIGLDHIDRSSRYRGIHTEKAIRILN